MESEPIEVTREIYGPNERGQKTEFVRCPACRELFLHRTTDIYGDTIETKEYYPHANRMKFCPMCGQEIRWGETR